MIGNRLNILVIEDNFFVAQDLANDIRANGDHVVGPFSDISQAISCLHTVQAAILDVRVHGHTTFSIADTLLSSRIPFVFLTGYDRRHIPDRFQGQGIYAKPSTTSPLLNSLHREHERIMLDQEDDIDAVVVDILQRARLLMPDEASAERAVESVLTRAIAEAGTRDEGSALRPWLLSLLKQETTQRRGLHLH